MGVVRLRKRRRGGDGAGGGGEILIQSKTLMMSMMALITFKRAMISPQGREWSPSTPAAAVSGKGSLHVQSLGM